MERRLDNVVHRLGFAPSRAAARQLVTHGHVLVNGKHCNIPSLLLKPGDVIAVKTAAAEPAATSKLALAESPPPVPDFLEMTATEPPEARVTRAADPRRRRPAHQPTSANS